MRLVLWTAFMTVIFLPICAAILAGFLFFQDTPHLPQAAAPTPEDVAAVRALVQDVRAAAGGAADTRLQTTPEQLNSALRLGGRFVPGLRGRVEITGETVTGRISVPVPVWPGNKWLNLTGEIPPFDGRIAPSRVTLGGRDVPPALALWVLRRGANLAIGNAAGDTIVNAATALRIDGETLTFALAINDMGKNGVMRGTFGALRGAEMPTQTDVELYHLAIRAAMEDGTLPQTGSFLPYLQFTLQAALEGTAPADPAQRYTAAILALAKVCGARDFAAIVGRLVFDDSDSPREWSTSCADVTFNDRIDSRRHFVTSAALQAASNRGFAVSVGEFKELYDTISGAGGFDFTDLAANLSGIALSNAVMTRPAEDWPRLLSRIEAETDVIVPFDGIPPLMTAAAFGARYGSVDSDVYRAELARIESRIDGLSLYRD